MLSMHKIGNNQHCTLVHNNDCFTNLVFVFYFLFLGALKYLLLEIDNESMTE
jgi:hypothetical protein